MKTAVIGLGVIGHVHMQILQEQNKNVVAVCDIVENKTSEFPDALHYVDYKKMIDEVKPDVVHICTPHYLHAEMVIYGLTHGVNVLCEKPLCISKKEIDEILFAEENSTAQLGVVLQNRYNPANAFVKEYLKDKEVVNGFGTVVWCRDAKYYAQDKWRGTVDQEGGGVLINQAIHTLDILEWLCGEPDTVVASKSNLTLQGKIEVEDTITALYKGKANFSFFATNGSVANYDPELTLAVKGELIRIFADQVIIGDTVKKFDRTNRIYGKSCYGTSHEYLIAKFYDCIANGKKFEIDGKEGCKVVKLVLSAYESCGQEVKI